MIEIRVHGRGGQGGVTLAKLIATTRFLQGDSAQAFGLYAAERAGAPVQAFCRYDAEPIANRNLIYEPDHVVVLDRTLVGPAVAEGLRDGGWILVNSPAPPESLRAEFPRHRLATVDATSIARDAGLGTRALPIVNTALAGAVGRLLGFGLPAVEAALAHLGLAGGNLEAARRAYERVTRLDQVGDPSRAATEVSPLAAPAPPPSFLDGAGGDLPGIRTGLWATQRPHRQRAVPPCNHVCPAGNDVQGFLHALAGERVDEALSILLSASPFPGVCGRVCPAPCTETCNRIGLDGAVNVPALERFAADHGIVALVAPHRRREKVAIVGSGPAGLSAAYHLARLGYGVTVYESGEAPGGLLRTGIPAYRLPAEVVDREVERIVSLGVEVRTGERVDAARLLELARDHDAVLVATGLQGLARLDLGSTGSDGAVVQGIDFLARARRGRAARLDGETVVVVGGGNTAIDAARTALRLGAAEVVVAYRRTTREMPAIRSELEAALEEGVTFESLTQPVAFHPDAAGLPDGAAGPRHRLTCRAMRLGEPDASGRRRPSEIPGTDFDLPCDRVILALGQSPDRAVFPAGTELGPGGRLADLETPVYALGDLATGDGTVAAAIGAGRRAAFGIHRQLSREPLAPPRAPTDAVASEEVVPPEAMKLHLFERAAPSAVEALAPWRRSWNFAEVHSGLADPGEARRCLSCGVCNDCDRCVTFCPERVLRREGGRLVFDYDHCKGCGVCAAECPRDVVVMSQLG